MSYNARVVQILIASPDDVGEDRNVLAEVIQEWNYVNSRDKGLVLLPVRWETHSAPEMGESPQVIINRQLADQCDIVVGAFWTRLGTPTGVADSGTAEEIERAGNAGKPVMLYFSQKAINPDSVDIEQLAKLREFKSKTFPKGLVEQYTSETHLRETFTRQLAMRIRDVVAEDSARQGEVPGSDEPVLISFALARGDPPSLLPSGAGVRRARTTCVNREDIPDFVAPKRNASWSTEGLVTIGTSAGNINFYRQVVDWYCKEMEFGEFRVAIDNSSDKGIGDPHLDIRISSPDGAAVVRNQRDSFPSASPSMYSGITFDSLTSVGPLMRQSVSVDRSDNDWRIAVEWPVIQAGRTLFSDDELLIGAATSTSVSLEATVYSSSYPPFSLATELQIEIEQSELTFEEILKQCSVELPSPGSG